MTAPGEVVQWRDKGFWQPDGTLDAAAYRGRSLFDGGFTWPAMVLRESALAHNVATLATFAAAHGLLFAPHGKTTMAPAIYRRQLVAGAWGLTVATANQLVIARRAGIERVLVANEILDRTALAWVAADLDADPSAEVWCYVDSPEGVAAVSAAAEGTRRGIGVLLDVGYPGGRTGCRDDATAFAVAQDAARAPGVRLEGVSGYEGGLTSVGEVTAHLARLRELTITLHDRGLLPDDPIVSAGGSAWFDVVGQEWASGWPDGLTPRKVLRSGAYVSHDDGVYTRKTPYAERLVDGRLDAAIEVWAQVISPGDPGRVIVGMGKRDASYDEGMPVPLRVRRAATGTTEPLAGCVVEKLDDHHGYLVGDAGLVPGDLVCFGISHPCTAFDKWALVPVLDDEDRVVDVVRTYF